MSHEDLKRKYEADALWHPRPWELWEWQYKGADNIWCQSKEAPIWVDLFAYRRKPDAPERNCAMCKHREAPLEDRAFTHCVKDNEKCICQACLGDKPHPDWCPLAQGEPLQLKTIKCSIHDEEYPEGLECRSCVAGLPQKEEPQKPDPLTAARDLLEWLEGFELVKGADKVKALREAVEEAEK